MRFHFGWKFHFGVQSALYLCSHELRWNETQTVMDFISVILTEMKFQTDMRFPCEQNLPKAKWIHADSLNNAFNAHVHLKLIAGVTSLWSFWKKWHFILGDKRSCKHYPKWNTCTCPSKYRVVFKCSRNKTSCEQNLFSCWFEISNRYDFISPLMWTYSNLKKFPSNTTPGFSFLSMYDISVDTRH